MTLTGVMCLLTPWQAPAFASLVGTTAETSPKPALAVVHEWPLNWLRTIEPIPKFDRELLHLQRFSADHRLATGTHAFADLQAGSNPPDAVAQTDAGQIGVECTSLTLEGRRAVQGLFMELRRRVQADDPVVFAKMAGHVVYVWFDEIGKPHKRSDTAALDALVQALAQYEPQTQQLWTTSESFPQQAPMLPVAETSAGARFYAVPIVNSAPSSMLFASTGFEIGLAYTTLVTAEAAWAEVQRLVDDHDKPGVDLLLVTAGGPDANGDMFPGEEAVAEFLVKHPTALRQAPNHIKKIILHSWGTGRATMLYPNFSPLFGPLYQSLVPVHHPLIVTADPVTSDPKTH